MLHRGAPTLPASGNAGGCRPPIRQPVTSRGVFGRSSDVAIGDRRLCVNAAIPQERPVAARFFDKPAIALCHEHCWLRARLGNDSPEWITHEGVSEEFDSVGSGPI